MLWYKYWQDIFPFLGSPLPYFLHVLNQAPRPNFERTPIFSTPVGNPGECPNLRRSSYLIKYSMQLFLLTAIWLPHSQLCAIIRGQPHSLNINHCVFYIFDLKVTGSPVMSYICLFTVIYFKYKMTLLHISQVYHLYKRIHHFAIFWTNVVHKVIPGYDAAIQL